MVSCLGARVIASAANSLDPPPGSRAIGRTGGPMALQRPPTAVRATRSLSPTNGVWTLGSCSTSIAANSAGRGTSVALRFKQID